jgi:hypothetical protein
MTMATVRVMFYEDRSWEATPPKKKTSRPYETRTLQLENTREVLSRAVKKELGRAGALVIEPIDSGRGLEIFSRSPSRRSGPYCFWRRITIDLVSGHPYELEILQRFLLDEF